MMRDDKAAGDAALRGQGAGPAAIPFGSAAASEAVLQPAGQSSAQAAKASGKSPGLRLRAARERLGLSVQQVADRLRLHPTVIDGIESDDYVGLGAPVYVRGHLRRVAELVGESGNEIEALFRGSEANQGMPDLTRIVTQKYRASQQSPRRLGTWPTVLIGALILIGGLVWWAMQQAPRVPSGNQVVNILLTSDTAASSTPAASAAPAESAPEATLVAGQPGSAPPTAPVGQSVAVPGATPGAAPVTVAAARAALNPNAPTPPSLSRQPIPRAAAGGDRLALHFREDSWVEAYGADGARLFYDVGSAGTQRDLTGEGPWHLVLGNADGVTLVLNGRTVTLGRQLRETPNVHLTLDRTGHVSEDQ